MIFIKTEEEVELIRQSNLLVSRTHAMLAGEIKEGVSTLFLDKLAEEFIRDNGGTPGFLHYNGFPNTLCVSVNDVVVHGIPSGYLLRNGDIVSVDCGAVLNGYNGDSCYTFEVGEVKPKIKALLQCTKECLYKGIEKAIVGNTTGDIGNAIQTHAESHGYSVVRELVGHGIGKQLHEEPEVPNYGRSGKGVKLRELMTIAIEPMINLGRKDIFQERDHWTIKTTDGKPSAHFEHTVAVRKDKAEILSDFSIIEEVLKKK
ncbi:MAG: type I methionyl aminopeptidase [Bacteroidales bacterium]|nr:type I methionyl aminopeptidase [Bacteroidales bacterium]MDD3858636.1 type I methionyl aminopeptidase [Bacteroidales bacterium]